MLFNMKTVLFQAIPFSISTLISSVWPIDRTLSGATILGQSWPGSDSNEEVLQAPVLSEPHHQIVECHFQDTFLWGKSYSLQRSSQCILQPQPTEQTNNEQKTWEFILCYLYPFKTDLWGSLNKFPDFFRMGTFIDSIHMKIVFIR